MRRWAHPATLLLPAALVLVALGTVSCTSDGRVDAREQYDQLRRRFLNMPMSNSFRLVLMNGEEGRLTMDNAENDTMSLTLPVEGVETEAVWMATDDDDTVCVRVIDASLPASCATLQRASTQEGFLGMGDSYFGEAVTAERIAKNVPTVPPGALCFVLKTKDNSHPEWNECYLSGSLVYASGYGVRIYVLELAVRLQTGGIASSTFEAAAATILQLVDDDSEF